MTQLRNNILVIIFVAMCGLIGANFGELSKNSLSGFILQDLISHGLFLFALRFLSNALLPLGTKDLALFLNA